MNHGRKKKDEKELSEEEKKKKVELAKNILSMTQEFLSIRNQTKHVDNPLDFSDLMAQMCPDICTIYNFRREIFKMQFVSQTLPQQYDLVKKEIDFTFLLLKKNPKSYALWSHRQWLVLQSRVIEQQLQKSDEIKVVDKELGLCTKMLGLDERNFHAWNYRNWLVRDVLKCDKKYLENELKFTQQKMDNNFSNFSALHFRSKNLGRIYNNILLTKESLDAEAQELIKSTIPQKIIQQELDKVKLAIYIQPNEQGIWQYYSWLINLYQPFQVVSVLQFKEQDYQQSEQYQLANLLPTEEQLSNNVYFQVFTSTKISNLDKIIEININGQKFMDYTIQSDSEHLKFSSVWHIFINKQSLLDITTQQNESTIKFKFPSNLRSFQKDPTKSNDLPTENLQDKKNFIASQFSYKFNDKLQFNYLKEDMESQELNYKNELIAEASKILIEEINFIDNIIKQEPKNHFVRLQKCSIIKQQIDIMILQDIMDVQSYKNSCEQVIQIINQIKEFYSKQINYLNSIENYWKYRIQIVNELKINKQDLISKEFEVKDTVVCLAKLKLNKQIL